MRTSSYFSFSSFLTLTLSLARAVSNSPTYYEQKLSVVGPGFFDQFNWETQDDPTHGRVNYLSLEGSIVKGLTVGWLSLLVRPVLYRLIRRRL